MRKHDNSIAADSPIPMIGVLGGGHLGLLLVRAAERMGYPTTVLDPDPQAPAHGEARISIVARYDDRAALGSLAANCAAVTVELEAIPVVSLRLLARTCFTTPSPEALAIAGDRLRTKRMLRAIGLPTPPFAEVLTARDMVPETVFPGILKTARNGHDGQGQAPVRDARDVAGAWRALGCVPCVLEREVSFDKELCVILARGRDARIIMYPVVENSYRDGILDSSHAPAAIPAATAARAAAAAALIAESLDHVGVLAAEFFLHGRDLLVNEFALRPHASGQFTIDACATSQFEQQVRVLAGVPLGPVQMRSGAATVNILGGAGQATESMLSALARGSGVALHLYSGADRRALRRMAHFTVLDQDVRRAVRRAEQLRAKLPQCELECLGATRVADHGRHKHR